MIVHYVYILKVHIMSTSFTYHVKYILQVHIIQYHVNIMCTHVKACTHPVADPEIYKVGFRHWRAKRISGLPRTFFGHVNAFMTRVIIFSLPILLFLAKYPVIE